MDDSELISAIGEMFGSLVELIYPKWLLIVLALIIIGAVGFGVLIAIALL